MGTAAQPALETLPSTDEHKKFQLEALKAIRESAYQRWQQRRTYEWQLSISIWTALAAFSGLVISGAKPIQNPERIAPYVALAGLAIAVTHLLYFWSMAIHLIADTHIQRIVEQEIWALGFPGRNMPPASTNSHDVTGFAVNPNAATRLQNQEQKRTPVKKELVCYPRLRRYGVCQVAITFVLALCAAVTVFSVGQQAAPAANSSNIVGK